MAMMLPVALSGAGCQSDLSAGTDPKCVLAPGMTTDQLSSCGCFPASPRPLASLSLNAESAQNPADNVSIQNYFCPLRSTGLARVVVVNGIVQRVFN